MKKKMDINEWYARITGELTKEEYQTLQDVIMNQLEVD